MVILHFAIFRRCPTRWRVAVGHVSVFAIFRVSFRGPGCHLCVFRRLNFLMGMVLRAGSLGVALTICC